MLAAEVGPGAPAPFGVAPFAEARGDRTCPVLPEDALAFPAAAPLVPFAEPPVNDLADAGAAVTAAVPSAAGGVYG